MTGPPKRGPTPLPPTAVWGCPGGNCTPRPRPPPRLRGPCAAQGAPRHTRGPDAVPGTEDTVVKAPGATNGPLQVAPLIARRKRACLGGRGVPGPRQDGRRGHTTLGDSPAVPRERRGLFIRFWFPPIK